MQKMDVETKVNDDVEKKNEMKKRRKRRQKQATEMLKDFTSNTTLHGLRYVTDVGLTTVEKLFWALTFVVSVILCFLLIRQVWLKWMYSPVIVSFNERMIPVGEVPFPSITICPQWKCNTRHYKYEEQRAKHLQYTQNATASNMTQAEIMKLENIILLCETELEKTKYLVDRDFANSSLVADLLRVSPRLYEIILKTRWRGTRISAYSAFKRVLTEEGVCYNFNALTQDQIFNNFSIQHNYRYMDNTRGDVFVVTTNDGNGNITRKILPYPFYGREYGAQPDFELIITESPELIDGLCNSLSNGIKIYVQNPGDVPQSSMNYYAAVPGQITSLAIKAVIMNTSDSLQGYSTELRQCYFPEDRQLKYFKTYTHDNCRLECLSLYTYQRCKCVLFHMPHSNASEICPLKKYDCVATARDDFASGKLDSDFKDNCKCLPPCDSTRYKADMVNINFDFVKNFKAMRRLYELSDNVAGSSMHKLRYSMVQIYFRDPSFVSMRRSELFGVTDFMANCGGLLGLFLGFSFLSLVEIFYFCSLRLWCTLRKNAKEEKKDSRVQ